MILVMSTLSSPRRDLLVATMLALVGERGLEALSVRVVAGAGGVSIGTVQHYFATKDAMLTAAFEEVVHRVRARVQGVELGDDVRQNLGCVLAELLPLDDERRTEVRVQLAFAARAAVTPGLAAIQRGILEEITVGLGAAFLALGQDAPTARLSARVALAAADGLAQHAVSTSTLDATGVAAALDRLLDAVC